MTPNLDATQTLAAAIAVLFIGSAVQLRVGFLRDNNIPVPVIGGLLFAVLTTVLFLGFDFRISFDMSLKEPMMLAFFTTIGLGADFRLLARGGPKLLLFGVLCLAYLIVQDGLGLLAAIGMDLHPLVGLLSSSITLSGGHGTGAAYAERFGVYDKMQPFLANSLGSQETTLFKMVSAYSMFANGGERVEPTLVDRVQDRWGTTVYRHDDRVCDECSQYDLPVGELPRIETDRWQVIDPVTAYQLTSMMRGVVERGTASGTVNLGVPTAGKTGTTNDARDVWFVGFTSNIAAGCYIGYDLPKSLGSGASGGGMCGPVFQSFMTTALKKYGAGRFAVPAGGRFIKIDRFTGARLPDGASGESVVAEYFREGEEPVFGITFDGGFAMGANLPMVTGGTVAQTGQGPGVAVEGVVPVVPVVPGQTTAGEISSGGLY